MGTADGVTFQNPQTAAVDCSGKLMYVLESKRVVRVSLDGSMRTHVYPLSAHAGPASERPLVHEGVPVFAGFWMQSRDLFAGRSNADAVDGFGLGYRLTLPLSGDVEPLLPPFNRACPSMLTPCLAVSVDRWARGDAAGWIGCQGGGASEIALYSDDRKLLRTIDARSPLFRHDNTTTSVSDDVETKVAWHQRNSSVKFCGTFGRYVAVVHFTFASDRRWQPGVALPPEVLLSIIGLDGERVLADIALRDFPIASDGNRLYVLVYGAGPDRADGRSELVLDEVAILDDNGELDNQLLDAFKN
jgi:hypothetical protein